MMHTSGSILRHAMKFALPLFFSWLVASCADNSTTAGDQQEPVGSYASKPVSVTPVEPVGASSATYSAAPASPTSSGYTAPPAQHGQPAAAGQTSTTYSENEIVEEGQKFFGSAAKGMADAVHSIFARYGEPNAFIRGEEGTGAIIVGLRYGEGELVMKEGGITKLYWQGPSVGWDFGGNAVKSFTLIYNLPAASAIFQRFPGVEGSAYLVGGISVNYQQRGHIVLAPMRAGVGLRLGASVGYLNYTPERDWMPF